MDRQAFISRYIRLLARACAILAAGLLLAASSGCGLMQKCGCGPAPETYVPISRIDAVWQQELRFTDNTQTGGQVPGVLGRVWLYTAGGKAPVDAPGAIEAWMYDVTPTETGGKMVLLASWRFNPRDLPLLKSKDMVGVGCSLFLPLENYRADIKHVRLSVAFVDEKGNRTAAAPEILTLRADDRVVRMYTEQQKLQLTPVSGK